MLLQNGSLKMLYCKVLLYNKELLLEKLDSIEIEYLEEELLLELFRKWESKLPSFLDGEFAFALYDAKNKKYFCARDPLGIKALYYTKSEEDYKFSSNIDELLNLPNILKKPNLKSMKIMLYHGVVDYTDTMYEGIYRIPPGHFMIIKDGKEQLERYWFPENIEIDYNISEKEAAKKLKELFLKAVDQSVTHLEETAFEVSGGLDSSSVVSLLSQTINPSSIDSYSMDFGKFKCDEGKYVDSILDKYPLHHQKISSDKLDYQNKYSLKNLYKMSPNWPIVLTFAMTLPMLEQMKKDGKRVVLTGQGGDHLFTGTPLALYDLFKRLKFAMVYQEIRTYKKPWNAVKSYIIRPIIGEKAFETVKEFMGRSAEEQDPFMNKQSNMENLTQKIGISSHTFKNDLDTITSLHNSTVLDGNIFHCAENYFDIEFRHPFFNKDLIEFALSLPPEMKYQKKTIKWIWRKAMDGILPDMIRDRKDKAEFSEVITQQIDAIDLDSLLSNPYIVKLGLIEQSLIDKHRKEYENKTVKYILILWSIINVEYWYRYNFTDEL